MYNNYDYPAGADNQDAPWNQNSREPEEIDIDIVYSAAISKKTYIRTNDYIEGEKYEESSIEDGESCKYMTCDPPDFSNTDFKRAYSEDHYSPIELMEELKQMCNEKIQMLQEKYSSTEDNELKKEINKELSKTLRIKKECYDWVLDEEYVDVE